LGYNRRRKLIENISDLEGDNMVYTVTEILQKAKEIIEQHHEIGGYIQIQGEIGTFKIHAQHAYLTLKEKNAVLKSVYFMIPKQITNTIKEGSIVEAYGYLSIYEPRGEFQFYIKSMREISKTGLLMLEYEQIKQTLINEKIIPKPPEEKKPLPHYPKVIGVITSRSSAAFQDVIKTIEKRYPECVIQLFHSGVQGKAINEIVDSIQAAECSQSEILLLVRGGGAIEDLWCFNHPDVVKAVRKCQKSIIVGVGHETDHTLSEYAADAVGSTPTAAAVLATPDMKELIESKKNEIEKIRLIIKRKIENQFVELNHTMKIIHHFEPARVVAEELKSLQIQMNQIENHIEKITSEKRQRLSLINKMLQTPFAELKFSKLHTNLVVNIEKIKANDPLKYLKKGYAKIEKGGITVNSVVQLKASDLVNIYLQDGMANSKIISINKNLI